MNLMSDATRSNVLGTLLSSSLSSRWIQTSWAAIKRTLMSARYEPFLKIRSRGVGPPSDDTGLARPRNTMCLDESEAPPRAAHWSPSSRFLTSSTAFLPLGSSILQLYRTRFTTFPAGFTLLPTVTGGTELLSEAPHGSHRALPPRPHFPLRCSHPSKNVIPSQPRVHSPTCRSTPFT